MGVVEATEAAETVIAVVTVVVVVVTAVVNVAAVAVVAEEVAVVAEAAVVSKANVHKPPPLSRKAETPVRVCHRNAELSEEKVVTTTTLAVDTDHVTRNIVLQAKHARKLTRSTEDPELALARKISRRAATARVTGVMRRSLSLRARPQLSRKPPLRRLRSLAERDARESPSLCLRRSRRRKK